MLRHVVLVAVLVAGCSEAPTPDPPAVCTEDCPPDGLLANGRDLRYDLLANDTLDAPKWQVGDVFEQHMFFGRDDAEGRHIKTIVVRADSGYTIATPDEDAARFEAVYDYPILGEIGSDLEATAFGSDWSGMYSFPLSHGKTWQTTLDDVINWNSFSFTDFDVTLTASYEALIDTPHGDYPGFWIDGVSGGELLMRYNYVPAIGWFSHLWIYDLETPEDDVMFHAMSMGVSKGYEGPYATATARTVIDEFFGVFPDPTGPVQGDPPMPKRFQIGSDQRLMGVAVPIAVGGHTEIHLVEPDGTDNRYAYEQTGMDGSGFAVYFLDLPGEAGDWTWSVAHGGVASGHYTWVTAVDTQSATLAPDVAESIGL